MVSDVCVLFLCAWFVNVECDGIVRRSAVCGILRGPQCLKWERLRRR